MPSPSTTTDFDLAITVLQTLFRHSTEPQGRSLVHSIVGISRAYRFPAIRGCQVRDILIAEDAALRARAPENAAEEVLRLADAAALRRAAVDAEANAPVAANAVADADALRRAEADAQAQANATAAAKAEADAEALRHAAARAAEDKRETDALRAAEVASRESALALKTFKSADALLAA